VLRPTAEKVDELRGLPDKQLLDDWFTEFTRLRSEMQALKRINGSNMMLRREWTA
jgi:hypothetical protein